MMRWIVLGSGIYLLYAGLVFSLQRRILFPGAFLPAEAIHVPPATPGVQTSRVATDFGSVDIWYLPPTRRGGRVPAFIHAHGNAELLGGVAHEMSRFTREGFAVLMVEYPGYGLSDGSPSRKSIAEAMIAAYDWLATRPDVEPSAIVGMGRSLGTGAIADLSRERPLAAMILQSPYTRAADFAKGYLLPSFLVRDRFDNLAVVRNFDGPVLVLHGTRDEVVPYGQGASVAEAAGRASIITWDCGHNDCPPDWGRFVEQVTDFMVSAELAPARLFRAPPIDPPAADALGPAPPGSGPDPS